MRTTITGFTKGIISLIISQIFIKIFGLVYSLYLTNKTGFGDTGNAIYMSGYQIYALLLTISSIGVPSTVSKMISEKNSIKDYVNENRIFKTSVFIFSAIGFVNTIVLFLFSGFIADRIIGIPATKLSLIILSPAIFFVSVTSVFRGYCNGENNIEITAKSQFIEQVIKTIFTIVFVEIISKYSNNNEELMAAGANGATTIATLTSLLHIMFKYKKIEKKIEYNNIFPKEKISFIINNILKISVPIIISVLLSSFSKNIDSITIVRYLKKYFSEEEAMAKYGIISSKVDILIAFPLSFNLAISTSIIPEIARNRIVNNLDGIINKIRLSFWISLFIGIPCTFGMFFYSKEIFCLLFPNAREGSSLLSLASISIVFLLMSQTITGILQGLGKNKVPLYATIVGLILKTLCNILLVPVSGIYEKGAIIGDILSNIVIFIIEFFYLKYFININVNIIKIGIKQIIASIIMIVISKLINQKLNILIDNKMISIIISIFSCIVIYIFLIISEKFFKKQNILKMFKTLK